MLHHCPVCVDGCEIDEARALAAEPQGGSGGEVLTIIIS